MRESQLEAKHRKIALAHGWFVEKIQMTGRGGFPDRFYAKDGRVVLIEWKKPLKKARKQQVVRHGELRAAGIEVYVIDNIVDANDILQLPDH